MCQIESEWASNHGKTVLIFIKISMSLPLSEQSSTNQKLFRGKPLRIGTLYHPEEPGHIDLFEALAEHAQIRALAPFRWKNPAYQKTLRRVKPLLVPFWPNALPWGKYLRGWAIKKLLGSIDYIVFTRPDQAPLLPAFKHLKSLYLVNDDYRQYGGGEAWNAMEREMLRHVDQVFAVSKALAERLLDRYDLKNPNIWILPNAVPTRYVPRSFPSSPSPPPSCISPTMRPLAGILGGISSRLRLDLLEQIIESTPWLHWVLAGEVHHDELLPEEHDLLDRLLKHPRVTTTGWLPYDQLASIAASLDVAVMPYSERAVNPLGSPMRLFLHLPHGTPILATSACRQISDFVPLVQICDDAETMIKQLEILREQAFDDGLRQARWLAAAEHTWEYRALQLLELIRKHDEA
jgi:glycosyltransferase involved in cell wall biosynthesis